MGFGEIRAGVLFNQNRDRFLVESECCHVIALGIVDNICQRFAVNDGAIQINIGLLRDGQILRVNRTLVLACDDWFHGDSWFLDKKKAR